MSEPKHWLLRKTNIRKCWGLLYFVLFLSILAEFFVDNKSYFGLRGWGVDGWFAFSAWFGFLACLLMVIIAKLLGLIIKRNDEYYHD